MKTKISYPKTKAKVLSQTSQKEKSDFQQQKNYQFEQEIDELKTKSQNLPTIDTSTLQPKLTAGQNVTISDNNVISATDTTYTAGQNVTISDQNVISATNTEYTAGQNITITNGVISASSCGCAQSLAQINSALSALDRRVTALENIVNPSPYLETIEKETDTYERELDLVRNYMNTGPTVLFITEPHLTTLDENQEEVLHAVTIVADITIKFKFSGADTFVFKLYNNSTLLKTTEVAYTSADTNIEQTVNIKSTITDMSGLFDYYFTVTAKKYSPDITLTYVKMEIEAPNVTILNKVEPFEVSYNYYTNKYYLSDCSTGYAKLAEISPNNLSSTQDIVWTQTDIPAQNYKTYFVTKTENGVVSLDKQYAILTNKNNRIYIRDLSTGTDIHTVTSLTHNVSPIYTKGVNSMLFRNTSYNTTIESKYFTVNQAGSLSAQRNMNSEANIVRTDALRNHLAYLSIPQLYGNFNIYKDGTLHYYNQETLYKNFDKTFVQDFKGYLTSYTNGSNFVCKCLLKKFDKYYQYDMNVISGSYSLTNETLLGEYNNMFCGINNDYFAVSNGTLTYIPPTV